MNAAYLVQESQEEVPIFNYDYNSDDDDVVPGTPTPNSPIKIPSENFDLRDSEDSHSDDENPRVRE